jgi:hypothetical protein
MFLRNLMYTYKSTRPNNPEDNISVSSPASISYVLRYRKVQINHLKTQYNAICVVPNMCKKLFVWQHRNRCLRVNSACGSMKLRTSLMLIL